MRRNPGATAALLQKANSQLRGEKIEKPEDELNAYISSLTQKTSKQKSVNFEDLGESISISSDIEDADLKPGKTEVTSSGSKFLKKKPGVESQSAEIGSAGSKFVKQKGSVQEQKTGTSSAGVKFFQKAQASTGSPAPAGQPQQRYGSQSVQSAGSSRPGSQLGGVRQVSSALDKASALTGKIQQRAATRRPYTLESDSDESFSAMKQLRSNGEQISESQSSSVKIGRDAGKFLKKATLTPTPATKVEPPRATVAQQGAKSKTSPRETIDNKAGRKASPFQLKSSLRYSTDVVLTSEEESLAEFVGGLPSSSDSLEKSKRQHGRPAGRHTPSPPPAKLGKGRRSPSPPPRNKSGVRPSSSKSQGRSVSPQNKPPVIRRTPSPSPRTADRMSPGLRRRSPSPKLMRSFSDDSNVAESIVDEVADDFGFNVIMDLDELGPSVDEDLPPRTETALSRSNSPSPVQSSARKSERQKKRDTKSAKKSKSDKSVTDKPGRMSPFHASVEKESSVFKASKSKDQSPFKASSTGNESPFQASKEREKSPFKSEHKESLFQSGGSDSPFKTKRDSSPIQARNKGSVFKASDKTSSPFRAKGNEEEDSKRSTRSAKKRKEKKESSSTKKKEKSKKGDRNTDNVFSSFGIQTVEDLLGHSVKESEYESIRSGVEEVNSEISEEIKTEKPGVYSYSQKFEDSATEIATEYDATKKSEPVYTEDFDSISERIGYSSDKGRSSASEVKTKYSGEETEASYTEYSDSETESVVSQSKYTEDEEEKTYSESYSEYSEDFTKSMVPTTSRSDVTPMPRRGMSTAQVQTAVDGLMYTWDPHGTGIAFPGVPYGLHFVDPTPIATHVVSADSLEAMTAYSPAMLALQDMLKSQLELTREYLDTQKRLYGDFSRNIQPSFRYTTLEDTKKYIKKHKKKKLTFKEALQLVDLEMARKSR